MECRYAGGRLNRNGLACGTVLDAMDGAGYYAPFYQVQSVVRLEEWRIYPYVPCRCVRFENIVFR